MMGNYRQGVYKEHPQGKHDWDWRLPSLHSGELRTTRGGMAPHSGHEHEGVLQEKDHVQTL